MNYDPLYVAYIIYFNRDQDYFECHEVLEELWLKEDREPIYKGLLQVAVGLYHFRNGNRSGATKMLHSASSCLAPYPADALGIDLGHLLSQVEKYAADLDHYETEPFEYYDLSIRLVDPKLIREVKLREQSLLPNIPQRRGPQRGAKYEASLRLNNQKHVGIELDR